MSPAKSAMYLDCNATTPLDPRVRAAMVHALDAGFGNATSRLHAFGERAWSAVQHARDQVAAVVGARKHEIVFTSGATESNNLAILGLAEHGRSTGKRHIVSTQIEHSAVLEPLRALSRQGFEVTMLAPDRNGAISADTALSQIREDTLLISVMQVNNETGIRQPISAIAAGLVNPEVYFHVDAAQGFGKDIEGLRHSRIDLISVTAHKIYGPQGIGALVARRRGFELPPLRSLMKGGGQEFDLRPGTLPTHLIVSLGAAAELALQEHAERAQACGRFRAALLDALLPLNPTIHGDPNLTLPHVLNVSFPHLDSERAIEAVSEVAAISNGSACTSMCASASHVLTAMQVPADLIDGAVRFSWCHTTDLPDLDRLRTLLANAIAQAQARGEACNTTSIHASANTPES